MNLTGEVQAMMRRLAEPARRAQEKVLKPFTASGRTQFLALLTKFVETCNAAIRTPLMPE